MYDILDKYSSKIIDNVKKINQNYNYIAVPKLPEVQILKQSKPKDNRKDNRKDYTNFYQRNTITPVEIGENKLPFNSKTVNIIGTGDKTNVFDINL